MKDERHRERAMPRAAARNVATPFSHPSDLIPHPSSLIPVGVTA
jgi:hypothetical protein